MKIINTKVENMTAAFGIDVKKPRFSWRIKSDESAVCQTEYRIIVSENPDEIQNGKGGVWDSGAIKSDVCFEVRYNGAPLKSRSVYYYKIFAADNKNNHAESETGFFQTGMTDGKWKGEWTGSAEVTKDMKCPLFRKDFESRGEIKRATAYISGLGFYELYINGQKVGDRIIEAGSTNYELSVLYSSYDVTGMIKDKNAVGVMLGRGRYAIETETDWDWTTAPWKDTLKFLLDLYIEYTDGTTEVVKSDASWKCAEAPVHSDCIYCGEIYDARCEKKGWNEHGYNDSSWGNAELLDAPGGELVAQVLQPVRTVKEIKAKSIKRLGKGHYVFDFGIITAGNCRLKVCGSAGDEVTVIYCEKLRDDGTVNNETGQIRGRAMQVDKYILSGNGTECWEPLFTYKGYQYVELINYPNEADGNSLVGLVQHNDVENTGYFECSNPLINQIHENTRNAIVNNLHHLPTDTPVYEKNGWTGDAQLSSHAAMHNFDMIRFYKKWIRDVAETQQESGEIRVIAPGAWHIGCANPPWDAALMLMPLWCYEHYGDADIIEEHYCIFKKYMDFIGASSDDYIISTGLNDWLAPSYDQENVEGCSPDGKLVVATCYYYLFAAAMEKYAELLALENDRLEYKKLSESIKEAFNRKFFDEKLAFYRSDEFRRFRQTHNAFPLAAGLVNEEHKWRVANRLANEIVTTHKGHLDTGIVGTKYLFPALCENGFTDLAYEVVTKKTYPGYGFMIENGATALWEAWELSSRSLDHHMFGSVCDLFYQYFAGIKPGSAGFKSVCIKPYVPEKLDFVKCGTMTRCGMLSSEWKKTGTLDLRMEVTIPANTDGVVYLPVLGKYKEHKVNSIESMSFSGAYDDYISFKALSGSYVIASKNVNGMLYVDVSEV